MAGSVNIIPRSRLRLIPAHLRLAHEYCFFLHDECAGLLVEYEADGATIVTVQFRNKAQAKAFNDRAKNEDAIAALRGAGFEAEARRVILNQTTMAMVSDCLHHLYEALRCLEKRKVIVALNLMRKPLTDSLLYLSWMHGDEDGFYHAFSTNSPSGITASILKQRRADILSAALSKTDVMDLLDSELIDSMLFDQARPDGFQKLFQHAVHLITVKRVELQTTPENFNFIFKDYTDDDLYELVYGALPQVLLYLSHVIFGLFDRIEALDAGSQQAFYVRSVLGLFLVDGPEGEAEAVRCLASLECLQCPTCHSALKLTSHNAARLVIAESFRCSGCRRVEPFPLSWIF